MVRCSSAQKLPRSIKNCTHCNSISETSNNEYGLAVLRARDSVGEHSFPLANANGQVAFSTDWCPFRSARARSSTRVGFRDCRDSRAVFVSEVFASIYHAALRFYRSLD